MTNVDKLYEVIHSNQMHDYEETNMAFIAAKLVQLSYTWDKKLTLILRCDFIDEKAYWFIRYFRSKKVEPSCILTTRVNFKKYSEGGILGIPVIDIDKINYENTKNSILIIVSRESDKQIFTQEDYKEADYGFCFRARGYMQFTRDRGIENYYHLMQNETKYYDTLKRLEDEESKKTFIEVIRSLIENDIYRYHEYKSEIKYFDDTIYKPLNEKEVWINCGSCTGDTILHYLSLRREFKKIWAVEIEDKMIKHLKEIFSLLPQNIQGRISLYNKLLEGGDSVNNIDHVFKDEKISLINMDIEGAEMMVLEGAKSKIKEDMPVLAIAAYHKPEDLVDIPKFILNLSENYHVFFRKYRGYCPEAMNEYIYYAVPPERIVKNETFGSCPIRSNSGLFKCRKDI